MKYNTFDFILEGWHGGEEEAVELAFGYDWSSVEIQPGQTIAYGRHVATCNGIEVYYDYGADYYFFCPQES
jgi:hypothetical protein